jgi:acyl-CoA thioesterase
VSAAFERDTAVEALAGGRFLGHVVPAWFTPRGANGGFLAAIVLRAIMESEPEVDRAPRSLTLHYLRPPGEGELTISVTEERRGRQLTTYSARAEQDGRLCILALAALSKDFPTTLSYGEPMPDAAPPNGLVVREVAKRKWSTSSSPRNIPKWVCVLPTSMVRSTRELS